MLHTCMLGWRLQLTSSIAEQSLSNDSLHNPSPPPKISNATKRRINKAKRQGIKSSEVEVDGNRVQGLPTFISEPSSLQVAGPPEIHVTTAANFHCMMKTCRYVQPTPLHPLKKIIILIKIIVSRNYKICSSNLYNKKTVH